MQKYKKIALWLFLMNCCVNSMILFAAEEACSSPESEECLSSSCCFFPLGEFSLYHTTGKGPGYRCGYTTLQLDAAFYKGEAAFQPFTDLRVHLFNNGKWAANAGIGGRYFTDCEEIVIGTNIYYDFREGHHHGDYHQIGVGAELLSPLWDLRINGYFPIAKRTHKREIYFIDNEGDLIGFSSNKERALGGFDVELGTYLWRKDPCRCFDFDLYAGVGPYYFLYHSRKNVIGAEMRLAATFLEYFRIEVIGSSDSVFHGNVQGRFEFRIPFGGGVSSSCCEDACDCCIQPFFPVERRDIIMLKSRCHGEVAECCCE